MYELEYTSLGKQRYDAIQSKAQKLMELGDFEHPGVSALLAVNESLDELRLEPESGLMLAGVVGYLFRVQAASFYIVYKIRKPKVVVIDIQEVEPAFAERLGQMLEQGDLNLLLRELGIKLPLSDLETKTIN